MSVVRSTSTAGAVAAPPLLGGRRVLVVEDETIVSFMLETLLLRHGCSEVLHAASVAAALRQLRDDRPDAAVLDVNLGDEPVYPVADHLSRLGIPLMFATGYQRDRLPERWRGCAMLQKPYRGDLLVALLANLLAAGGRALR